MVSKLAVTALVLIVAAPILLGYGLAFEEEDYVAYETSDRINVTDRVLNSSNPIYMASTSPLNNSELLATITYMPGGVTETSIKAPAYASVGSVYTSIPTYETITGYIQMSNSSQSTSGQTGEGGRYSIVGPWQDPNAAPFVRLSADQLSQLNIWNPTYRTTYVSPGTYITVFQSASDRWTSTFDNSTYTFGAFEFLSDRFPTYTVVTSTYTDITTLGTSYTLHLSQPSVIKINYNGGGTGYVPVTSLPSAGVNIIKQGSHLIIGDGTYDNVSTISVATNATQLGYSYTQQVSGSYADPSYGWTTNVNEGNPARIYWMNSQLNGSVRMLMEIQTEEFVDIQPMNGSTGTEWISIRKPTSTNVTVNGNSLGNYTYLCLDITGSSVTVSGIDSWPNMYTAPNLINSITVDMTNTLEMFDRVWLNGSTTINYRVDSAEILSGYFATTQDATIDMDALWPGKSFVLSLSSIGIYGDSITYAGQNFPVENNTITVNGKQIRLLQAAFSATLEDGEYTATINGEEVATTSAAPTLYLGGEWSLTLMAYNVERIEGTHMVWQAGEFAFNGADSSFALLGLLTCGAVFVGLGMYGRRSGAKVGMLMLITGCAALIFLAMI